MPTASCHAFLRRFLPFRLDFADFAAATPLIAPLSDAPAFRCRHAYAYAPMHERACVAITPRSAAYYIDDTCRFRYFRAIYAICDALPRDYDAVAASSPLICSLMPLFRHADAFCHAATLCYARYAATLAMREHDGACCRRYAATCRLRCCHYFD